MRRIAVRAVIVEDGLLLLVKLRSSKTGEPLDFYCTIGGGLDEGEGLVDGLKREIIEETGVESKIGKLLCIQQFTDKNDNIEFFFLVENAADFKEIDIASTTHGAKEIAEIGFYDPKKVEVLPKFLSEIDIQQLISSDEVRVFNYLVS